MFHVTGQQWGEAVEQALVRAHRSMSLLLQRWVLGVFHVVKLPPRHLRTATANHTFKI